MRCRRNKLLVKKTGRTLHMRLNSRHHSNAGTSQGQLCERGIAFGESRVICGFHFQSDIQAGRMAARALFLRLHQTKAFMKKMAAAKAELKTLR